MLINVYSKYRNDTDDFEQNIADLGHPGSLGYVLGELFEAYDGSEFIIQIEVLDSQLEESRQMTMN